MPIPGWVAGRVQGWCGRGYVARMARSRAVDRGRRATPWKRVLPVVVAALLGSVGWGWYTGGRITARIPATIIRDVDGDTVIARFADGHEEKIQLLGVDTPEVGDPPKPGDGVGHHPAG